MDGGWLGHVASESHSEVSEIEERAFVQDMLKMPFFFYKYSKVALEQIFGLFHLQTHTPIKRSSESLFMSGVYPRF